ncbi:DMT family transporter [Bacteroidales bacterium OttesenSCG-928-K03]|nr:DMT family transporter [Bacteroidales bacterium OttesenSCG-928-L14]MDL2240659.1 DMT family transporter [Bacteroidales bacterium OttesenSCG-928-K22]MDL2242833.1 DMT family transporter [Bacteroidales bacterium OttesenSCG-928-K03]
MKRGLVYCLVILSMIFWGITFVWTKDTLTVYNPITIITIRLLISSLMLFAYMKLSRKWEKIQKSDIKYFLALAFFSPFLYFIGETFGIKNSSSTIASVMIATIPIFSAISSVIVYKEQLSKLNFLGMAISFIGLLLVIVNPDYSIALSLKGFLWLMLAVIVSVFYALILRKISIRYNPISLVAYQNFIGFIYFLPLFFIFDFSSFITIIPSINICLNLFFLAVFGSSLAFIFFTIGNRELGVGKTSFFSNLIPIFTAITAFFILGEKISLLNIIGIITVILGLTISQTKKLKP